MLGKDSAHFSARAVWIKTKLQMSKGEVEPNRAEIALHRVTGEGMDWMTHRGPFQPLPFCDYLHHLQSVPCPDADGDIQKPFLARERSKEGGK